MKPSRLWIQLFGVCLLLLGGWICYTSIIAIAGYLQSGAISWGSRNRRETGEMALVLHTVYLIAGCWVAAKGSFMVFKGQEPVA